MGFLLSEIGGELVAVARFLPPAPLRCGRAGLELSLPNASRGTALFSVPEAEGAGGVGSGGGRLQTPSVLVLKLCQANAQSAFLFQGLGAHFWHWCAELNGTGSGHGLHRLNGLATGGGVWCVESSPQPSALHGPHGSRFACNVRRLLAV